MGGFLVLLRITGRWIYKITLSSNVLMQRRHTDIVTVVKVWAYSFGVTVVVALAYFILSKFSVR